MARKPKLVKPNAWTQLRILISEYVEAYEANSWKGGGDPMDVPEIEMRLALAELRLNTHMEKMQRDLGTP